MHEMALQMHALKKEMDGMKAMAKKVMTSTSIGRAPGKIAKHAIRVSLELLDFCILRLSVLMHKSNDTESHEDRGGKSLERHPVGHGRQPHEE